MKKSILIFIALSLFLVNQNQAQLQCLATNSTTISAPAACGTSIGGSVNGATSYTDSYSCLSGNQWIGGEAVYFLDGVTAGEYTFKLSGFATDLDMFILSACDEGSCISADGARGRSGRAESATVNLADGEDVYIVIDGKFVSNATFWLEVICNGKVCESAVPLRCTTVLRASTGSYNSTDVVNNHSSCGGGGYAGHEAVYHLRTSESPITIDLYPTHGTDLDLFVYDDCSTNLENCLGASNRSPWGESVYLDRGFNGGDGYVVVDGRSNSGPYELAVSCGDPCDQRPTKISCNSVTHSTTRGKPNNASYYSCDPFSDKGHNWGPESVFEIYLDDTYEIEIDLDIPSQVDLNLYLLKSSCDPASCIAGSKRSIAGYSEKIRKRLTRGKYFIVVEGYRGVSGDFTLSVSGCGCEIEDILKCGETTQGTVKRGVSHVSSIEGPCFTKEVKLPSEDVTYGFVAPEEGEYSFMLSGLDGGLDLFVMSDCQDPQSCLGSSTKSGNDIDIVNVSLEKNQEILVLVDGLIDAKNTDFNLEVICVDDEPIDDGEPDEEEETEEEDSDGTEDDMEEEEDTEEDILGCGVYIEGTTIDQPSNFGRSDYTCFRSSLDFRGGESVIEFQKYSDEDILSVHMFHGSGNLQNLSMFIMDSTMNEVESCKGQNFRADKSIGNGNAVGEYFTDVDNPLPAGTYYAILDGYNSRVESNYTFATTCGAIDCEAIEGLPCGEALVAENMDEGVNNESIYSDGEESYIGYTGPEKVYSFCVDSITTVNIGIYGIQAEEGYEGDLDIFLMENVCSDTKKVLASSRNEGSRDEQISMELSAGEYYLVVDGWNGSRGSYSVRNESCYSIQCGKSIKLLSKNEVKPNDHHNIVVSPNPFSDQVFMTYHSVSDSYVMSLFDATGRLVASRNMTNGKSDISDLFPSGQQGVFYLQINDQGTIKGQTVIRI